MITLLIFPFPGYYMKQYRNHELCHHLLTNAVVMLCHNVWHDCRRFGNPESIEPILCLYRCLFAKTINFFCSIKNVVSASNNFCSFPHYSPIPYYFVHHGKSSFLRKQVFILLRNPTNGIKFKNHPFIPHY